MPTPGNVRDGEMRGVRGGLLVALAFVAGCVDGAGYLHFGQIFTANMTGNTVLLGLALGGRSERPVSNILAALGGFLLGVAVGAPLARHGARRTVWPRAVTLTLALEGGGLLALATWVTWAGASPAGPTIYGYIGLAAAAMGLQSLAARRLGVPGITTTVVTTTLVSAVGGLLTLPRRRLAREEVRHIGEQGAVFLTYGAGALAATVLDARWWPSALWLAALIIALVALAGLLPSRA
jgi:uncharacterized membrane protein YoaK (UPF0700 family)